jgi:hypothetical protein
MKSVTSFFFQCLLFGLFLSGTASAQTADVPPASNDPASVSGHVRPAYVAQAQKTIEAILAESEFDQTRTIKVPRLKEPFVGRKKNSSDDLSKRRNNRSRISPDWGQFPAQIGQVALWLLAFGLIVLLVVTSKHWLPFLGWRRRTDPSFFTVHQSDSALEIAAALPEDIATAAQRYWNEGKKDEALSLLYRGTIELLATRYRIEPPQSATEEEIRLLVGNDLPSFKDSFGNIARAWLRLAYAHRPPDSITDLLKAFSRLQQADGVVS